MENLGLKIRYKIYTENMSIEHIRYDISKMKVCDDQVMEVLNIIQFYMRDKIK